MNANPRYNRAPHLSNTLACVNCNDEIELTDLMRTQVAAQVRIQVEQSRKSCRPKPTDKHNRDLRSSSQIEMIVSEALPEGVQDFTTLECVWVCSCAAANSLALALRHGLVELGNARAAVAGQHAKQELIYNYLASKEFTHRVGVVVEAFITMQTDLESERRAFKKQWSKREKQLESAIKNAASLYGDLQGIIGASLPKIET